MGIARTVKLVKLPNLKVIRLKRAKIQLRKVAKINIRLYGEGHTKVGVKFRDFEELYKSRIQIS